jgi:hypothetical protein
MRQKTPRDSGLDDLFRGTWLAVRENSERGAKIHTPLTGFCKRLRQNHPLFHEDFIRTRAAGTSATVVN